MPLKAMTAYDTGLLEISVPSPRATTAATKNTIASPPKATPVHLYQGPALIRVAIHPPTTGPDEKSHKCRPGSRHGQSARARGRKSQEYDIPGHVRREDMPEPEVADGIDKA
jgi:hypothetical protein